MPLFEIFVSALFLYCSLWSISQPNNLSQTIWFSEDPWCIILEHYL